MGYYTELVMAIRLKRDTPQKVIDVLNYLLHPFDAESIEVRDDHPFFDTGHAAFILVGDSYYFPGDSKSILNFDDKSWSKYYELTVRSNLKNYDNEIQKFLHWIAPFSQTGTLTLAKNNFPPTGPGRSFAGYMCYEEDELPTLIYFEEGKVFTAEVGTVEKHIIEY